MTEYEATEVAKQCGLGQRSEHIFGVWELPLKPIVTENILHFAREIVRLTKEELFPEGEPE